MIKLAILIVLLSLPARSDGAAPEVDWFRDYDGSRSESHGHFLMVCRDGGFLQVGETGFVGKNARILVVKTDARGNLLWKRELGSGGRNLGNASLEVADGYVICGMLNRDSAVVKLDKRSGEIRFSRSHDHGGTDAYEHLALTPEGFLAVGYARAEDPDSTFFPYGRGRLAFLDRQGRKLRDQSVDEHLSHPYRIEPLGAGYVIAGTTEDARDFGVVRIDAAGTVLWNLTLGGNRNDHCFGLSVGPDGAVFLTGHTRSGTKNWDTCTMKLNDRGETLWERKVGNPRGFDPRWIHDEAWGVQATPDGGCVIAAGTGDEYRYSRRLGNANSDQWEAYLVKFAADGTTDWQRTFRSGEHGGEGDWAAEDIALTGDGGAVVAIDNGQFGLLKLTPFRPASPGVKAR